MSLRTHAVVVQPDQWSGAPAELARLLAPLTGIDVAQLTDALARGPMTVEADLSPGAAQAIADRLVQLGVPAEIHPPTVPAAALPERGAVPTKQDVRLERARVTDEIPRTRRSTMMGHKPMVTGDIPEVEDDDDGGWGAVFPDLANRPSKPAATPKSTAPPSLDELEGDEPIRELTPPLQRQVEPSTPEPRAPEPPRVPRVPQPSAPSLAALESEPVASPPPPPDPPPKQPKKQPLKPEGFDPSRLAALLPEDEAEQPPFKPTGYDPRPEHHPPFAVMFAILAPGAGHVFNGDDEDALALGLRGWLVVPWVRSVRGVKEKAERIRTYWAPRPEDGSGIRAFKFVAAWWLCVSLIAASLAWGIPAIIRAVNTEPAVEGFTDEQIASVFESAHTGVLASRVKALDALEEASKGLQADPKYTMTDEERAERLFAIGYVECRGHSFSMCEAMMKRVLELRPAYRPALKLQAWASVSLNGRKGPMPDVGEFATLSELELNKLRDEMILEGEQVPPPPDPSVFASDDADMGINNADAGAAVDLGSPP